MQVWDDSNPFRQANTLWQISFCTSEEKLPIFEALYEEIAFSFSAIPKIDYFEVEIIIDDPETSSMLSQYKNIIIGDIKLERLQDTNWLQEVSSQISDVKTKYFHIQRRQKQTQNLIPIIIDNPEAFGMGEHSTTKSCIEALEDVYEDKQFIPKSILDIGTGTGILAVASKKLWPQADILAIDIDKKAIEITKYHAEKNNSIIALDMDLDKYKKHKFDIIVANILANPLLELSQCIESMAKPRSRLILAGFTTRQQDIIRAKYEELSFKILDTKEDNDWIIFTLQKL